MRHKIIFPILILFFISGCQKSFISKTGFWMGTVVDITLQTKDIGIVPQIEEHIKFMQESVDNISIAINELKPGELLHLNELGIALVKIGEYYKGVSDKRFDISVYTLSLGYGFPEGPYKIPEESFVKEALEKISRNRFVFSGNLISKTQDVKIDMGAYAKGFIVDNVSDFMVSKGVRNFIVNAGGDLFASGDKNGKPWKIAIKHPEENQSVLSIIGLKDMAVATSGNYERFFEYEGERYIHIFDAKTGGNANNYKSISVIAKDTQTADGFATVFFLMSISEITKLCSEKNLPVLVFTLDNRMLKLCGWENFEVH